MAFMPMSSPDGRTEAIQNHSQLFVDDRKGITPKMQQDYEQQISPIFAVNLKLIDKNNGKYSPIQLLKEKTSVQSLDGCLHCNYMCNRNVKLVSSSVTSK
ncbi:hypothetical protein CGZ75_10460 [Paenibacillus herberti]|uniref:Uncharacterized protein n=1 Tax=Paenibacillus herberti TaxID=1619309 RepID=A0A229P529_9BACL|nr:hypothetical protein CGZ75_10460 [Paenibacillus herberti]